MIGITVGVALDGGSSIAQSISSIFKPIELLLVVGLAILLALVATYVPAQMASQQDPASVLREE